MEEQERIESVHAKEYSEDEADLRLKRIERWISKKASDATLADVATIFTNLTLVIAAIVAAFIYDGQLAEMRHTNELTQKALDASDGTLKQTLGKMQGQIDVAKNLYLEAQKQTKQAVTIGENSGKQVAASLTMASADTDQAKTVQQEFLSSQRPWISTNFIGGLLQFSAHPVIEATGEYANVGHSVALKVIRNVYLSAFQDDGTILCKGVSFESFYRDPNSQVGTVIFPGLPIRESPGASKAYMFKPLPTDATKDAPLKMVSCVTYMSPVDNQIHHTRSVYFVYRKGENGSPANLIPGSQDVIFMQDINGSTAD